MRRPSPPGANYPFRLWQMLLGWGTVGLAYTAAGVLHGPAAVLHESALDRYVPFSATGVWLYLSFFALLPFAFLSADLARLVWLRRAMQISALFCCAVFLAWPTQLVNPPPAGDGVSATVLGWLTHLDTRQNCLPSLHGALTLLSVMALLERARPWRSLLVGVWGLAICISVIQIRQHVALDLAAGLLTGLATGLLACRPALMTAQRPQHL